ncbi:hypothetical protein [Aurantiacibacter sp. D1-12]|uniref:hypothetical protein n=1 Tax=Aurantiacibacter sp. D1-12 TaxID=2993658 RepID=UPI00237D1407|nr:hypothetical protein [Aurantiacibacter sp. D1-12]MDE1468187.1 hypothetical protein [Aurantiacibacter sp. D1-12]
MATAKQGKTSLFSILLRITGFVVVAAFLVSFFFGEAIAGYSSAGTGYAAKTSCSCRYVAGRDLDACYADFTPGMWPIWLSEDEEAQTITARVPLVDSAEASYREGYGCVLEPYGG